MIRGRQREIGRSLNLSCKKWLVILLLYKNLDTKRDRLRHKYAKGGSETDEGERLALGSRHVTALISLF